MKDDMTVSIQLNDSGIPIRKIEYPAVNTSHDLQRKVTELLHDLTMERGDFTLAELGYLHTNTIMYEQKTGSLNMRLYFMAKYAARQVQSSVNGGTILNPVDELNTFQNYFFVGDVKTVTTFEKILAPRSKRMEDEIGRASLLLKDKKDYEEVNALVIHCNFPISMAAIHNINLFDAYYRPKATPISYGKNRDIVTSMGREQIPVTVSVESTESVSDGYDPEQAVPYLQMIASRCRTAERNQEKLREKVRDTAKEKRKSMDTRQNKNFVKYS